MSHHHVAIGYDGAGPEEPILRAELSPQTWVPELLARHWQRVKHASLEFNTVSRVFIALGRHAKTFPGISTSPELWILILHFKKASFAKIHNPPENGCLHFPLHENRSHLFILIYGWQNSSGEWLCCSFCWNFATWWTSVYCLLGQGEDMEKETWICKYKYTHSVRMSPYSDFYSKICREVNCM